MSVWEWIRLAAGGLMILGGLFVFITAVIGNFRFPKALKRMHAASLGDTLGILLVMAGIVILCFAADFAVKLVAVIPLMWAAGSTCSHLIAHMVTDRERETEEEIQKK